MSSCCNKPPEPSCCSSVKEKKDYLLIVSAGLIIAAYLIHLFLYKFLSNTSWLTVFSSSIYELINMMFIGIIIGILFIGLLAQIPREFVIALLGRERNGAGVIRATLAGVLLDLCSHGILMVGAKLYERGASLGQVMAFLIASPWNSFSLTIILWSLVGFKWMFLFLISSMLIGISSGLIFEKLVKENVLPDNENRIDLPEDFHFWAECKKRLSKLQISWELLKNILVKGLQDSKMVLRWIFFGVVLAALIRSFVSPDSFQTYFGPTVLGLALTVIVATILEVCSEGTLPLASDLLNRAGAPGNSFTFLMTGVSTDYTEIMVLKEATGKWTIPLLLPVITLPQVLIFAIVFNQI